MPQPPMPDLRWTASGPLTQAARQALAEELDCAFTDEPCRRDVQALRAGSDVDITAEPQGDLLVITARYLPVDLRFPTTEQWLTEHVELACLDAGLRLTSGPELAPN